MPRPCSSSSVGDLLLRGGELAPRAPWPRSPRREPAAGPRAGRRRAAGGRSSKSTTNACSPDSGRRHREHDQVAGPAGADPVDRDALPAHRGGRLARLRQRQAQRGGEAGARHPEELALGLPGRRLEEGAGSPAELEHLQAVVDDDAGRAVPGQDHAVGAPGQGAVGPRRRGRHGLARGAAPGTAPARGARRKRARPGPAQEEPAVLARRGEPPRHAGGALRAAEEEVAGLVEAVVGRGQHAPLERLAEVDEDVPAAQQVQPGERGIARDVVPDEDAQLANGRADAPAALGPDEEALQPLLSQPAHRGVRVEPGARDLEGLLARGPSRRSGPGGAGSRRRGARRGRWPASRPPRRWRTPPPRRGWARPGPCAAGSPGRRSASARRSSLRPGRTR